MGIPATYLEHTVSALLLAIIALFIARTARYIDGRRTSRLVRQQGTAGTNPDRPERDAPTYLLRTSMIAAITSYVLTITAYLLYGLHLQEYGAMLGNEAAQTDIRSLFWVYIGGGVIIGYSMWRNGKSLHNTMRAAKRAQEAADETRSKSAGNAGD